MAAKKITTQTLTEFQAWLEGVEELQAKGWTPDKRQWAKIRKRISNIVESTPPQTRMPTMGQPLDVPRPSVSAIPNIGMAPPVPSAIPPVPADIEMSPAAKALLGGSPKTPDSSSDDGSSFA